MAETIPTTKGAILRSLLKFIEKDLSAEQRSQTLDALPAADRELAERRTVLASDKIPEVTLNRLTVEAAKAKGQSVDAFGRRAGRAELADSVGIYRFFIIVLTPTALMRKASTLWATVHSHGALAVESVTARSARVRLKNFPSEEAHCCRLAGWFEGAGEMTGVKHVSVVHDVCMTRGAADCQWQITWE